MKRFLKRILEKPNWHNLRTIDPVSTVFGYDRGTPLDRVFIEDFLNRHADYISGHVLEVGDDTYTKEFGKKVDRSDVLHLTGEDSEATIVGDLTNWESLPKEMFDCFICTETLGFIYDFRSAIRGAWHLLKPGGTMLATASGISQISKYDMDRWGDYWRFTSLSLEKSFSEVFGQENVEVDFYGNILAAVAFLHGISAEELTKKELFTKDDNYQVTIVVKAHKQKT